MHRKLFRWSLGVIGTLCLLINFVIHASSALVFGFLVWLLPRGNALSRGGQRLVSLIPRSWFTLNYWLLQMNTAGKWQIRGDASTLRMDQWYLMISNHQSWMDILVLGCVFRDHIPPLKFFMKKELLWQLPIAGACCYFLGFPLMSRHSKNAIRRNPALKGKDIETTRNACRRFKDVPTTVINFVEGTRFSTQKKQQQNAPYQHLLKPKAGGVAMVLCELHDCIDGIIDVTIQYHAKQVSFLKLLFGDVDAIQVDFTKRPVTKDLIGNYYDDRQFRARFQTWLNALWQAKDSALNQRL